MSGSIVVLMWGAVAGMASHLLLEATKRAEQAAHQHFVDAAGSDPEKNYKVVAQSNSAIL